MKEPENIEEPSTPQEQVEDKEEEKQEEEVVEKEDEPHETKNESEVPPLIATSEPTDLLVSLIKQNTLYIYIVRLWYGLSSY